MAITVFAAIDVGSHETAMRIYEISKKHGVHELEYLHHTARLGYETFSTRHISYHTIDKLCNILLGFKEKMMEYRIKDYMIIATSALREADNNLIVLDQVKQRTGFQIKILQLIPQADPKGYAFGRCRRWQYPIIIIRQKQPDHDP